MAIDLNDYKASEALGYKMLVAQFAVAKAVSTIVKLKGYTEGYDCARN